MHYLNIFYWTNEIFRKIKYFMNVNVLRRTWTWISRTIFCLRQRQETDAAKDLRTVSDGSWLRQLLSMFWDRDEKRALVVKHFRQKMLCSLRKLLAAFASKSGGSHIFSWSLDHVDGEISTSCSPNLAISKTSCYSTPIYEYLCWGSNVNSNSNT